MATSEHDVQNEGRYVHANGTEIYYAEAGQGEPLILLHRGLVSDSQVWAGHPWVYVSHMDTLAEHFRVIVPDTRGHGRTINARPGSTHGLRVQRWRDDRDDRRHPLHWDGRSEERSVKAAEPRA